MDLMLSLRRGWHAATRPFRLGHRLREMNANLAKLVARAEHAHQQLVTLLADLGHRHEQLAQQMAQQLEQARQQQSNKLQLLGRLLGQLPPLEQLRLLYPWPAVRPAVAPCDRGWDGGGRDLVTRRLAERPTKVILEIGSFLGLSTRAWLTAAPGATIVCIDPWFDFYEDDSSIRDWPDVMGKNIYHLFLSSCWEFRDRIIPVRGFSPDALQVVADLGVEPDLIYIDGNHDYTSVRTDLESAHRLFPHAILTGDDWIWDADPQTPFAVRKAVEEFAAVKQWRVEARGNTWALDR
jgi:hypothetical protein